MRAVSDGFTPTPSLFLFAVVMDRLTDEVRQESLWTIIFADCFVIASENRDVGVCYGGNQKQNTCVTEKEAGMDMQGVKGMKVDGFKYLWSTIQTNRVYN